MNTPNANLYALNYSERKTYFWAGLFIIGNILLPQLCHLIPQGGLMFLPIYFFTLIGAYKFGWKVGLLTAVFSPLINNVLFGMPAAGMVPVILIKGTILALAAGYAAKRFGKASLILIIAVVAAYQILGGVAEWLITGSTAAAMQDIRIGMPGILLQIFGSFVILNYLIKR
jgi:hypothetical protein